MDFFPWSILARIQLNWWCVVETLIAIIAISESLLRDLCFLLFESVISRSYCLLYFRIFFYQWICVSIVNICCSLQLLFITVYVSVIFCFTYALTFTNYQTSTFCCCLPEVLPYISACVLLQQACDLAVSMLTTFELTLSYFTLKICNLLIYNIFICLQIFLVKNY